MCLLAFSKKQAKAAALLFEYVSLFRTTKALRNNMLLFILIAFIIAF